MPSPNLGGPDLPDPTSKLYVPQDIKKMMPYADDIIAESIKAKDDAVGAVVSSLPSNPKTATWSVANLFREPNPALGANTPAPQNDPYTMFLLATLVRLAYTSDDDAYQIVNDALPAFSYTRTRPGLPNSAYDMWSDSESKRRIIVFPGTTTLNTWLPYAIGGTDSLGSVIRGMDGAYMYSGIRRFVTGQSANMDALFTGPEQDLPLTVMVGHSAGGSAAQYFSQKFNGTSSGAMSQTRHSVCGVYTFGMPATFFIPSGGIPDKSFGRNHVRAVVVGDPVPNATQIQQAIASASKSNPVFQYAMLDSTPNLVTHTEAYFLSLANPPSNQKSNVLRAAVEAVVQGGIKMLTGMAQYHSIINYCNALEMTVRNLGDFPPYAPNVIQANRLLDSRGE